MKKTAVMLCLAALVVLDGGCRKKEEPPVQEYKVERGSIRLSVSGNGVVKPRNRLEIKPPISGRIDSVLVEEGQEVKKGEVIAWMSSSERAALLDSARAQGEEEYRKWEEVYKPTPIIAPLSGFIIKRDVEPGQTVGTGSAMLVMADTLIVECQIDETDLGRLKAGQKTRITLDAYPDIRITGKIEHIAYESEVVSNVTIYKVDILPSRIPDVFRSGMSATTDIMVENKQEILIVPVSAVNDEGGRKTVKVKKEEGEPEEREIETGIDDGSYMEIVSGLDEGEIIAAKDIPARRSSNRSGGFRGRFGLPGMGGRRR